MYGLIARLTAHDGKRDQLIDVLRGSAGHMPGYVLLRRRERRERRAIDLGERGLGQQRKPCRVPVFAGGATGHAAGDNPLPLPLTAIQHPP